MPVMVVRHAHALARTDWDGDDLWRPLSRRGERQATVLAGRLLESKPRRILSSPYLRCIQTVEPLAVAAGIPVEKEPRLAEGESRRAVELVRVLGAAGESVVLCSHGDVIPEILATIAHEDRIDLGYAPRVEKASVWVLSGDGGRFSAATYLKPPKT